MGETFSCSAPGSDHGFELLHKELKVPASGFVWCLTNQKGCWEQLTKSLFRWGALGKTCDPGGHFPTPCPSPSSFVDKGTDQRSSLMRWWGLLGHYAPGTGIFKLMQRPTDKILAYK